MKIGIYRIISPDFSVYIGQSINIDKRFKQHKSNRTKGHSKLKSSFDFYGSHNHQFEIIEECKFEDLNFRERYWLNHYSELGCDILNSNSIPCGEKKNTGRQKFRPIIGCSHYSIGSNGQVKRLRHKAHGKRYKILPEKIIDQHINRQSVVYVNVTDDNGKIKVFSVQKLVLSTYGKPGVTYYKASDDPFNNRFDVFIEKDMYDRMKYKPFIFKKIKL
jgi:group I intron endonuclease